MSIERCSCDESIELRKIIKKLRKLPRLILKWSELTPEEMEYKFGRNDFEYWAEVLVPLADELLKQKGTNIS